MDELREVAVLFARADSIYKTLPGCDVWDAERDARLWPGGAPIVGHPPCRAWGELSHFAKPRPDEKELAPWTIGKIREWGGVLEHPAKSKLWPFVGLPKPGERDAWGGWTYSAPQFWWGHKARKNTRFYICGLEPKDLPEVPFQMGEAQYRIGGGSRRRELQKGRKQLPPISSLGGGRSKMHEGTPPALAEWLVELARRTKTPAPQDRSKPL